MSIFANFRFQLYWHVCLVPGDHASVVWSVKSGCEGLAAVGLHSPALCTLLMVFGVILGFSIFVHIPITHFRNADAFMSKDTVCQICMTEKYAAYSYRCLHLRYLRSTGHVSVVPVRVPTSTRCHFPPPREGT